MTEGVFPFPNNQQTFALISVYLCFILFSKPKVRQIKKTANREVADEI